MWTLLEKHDTLDVARRACYEHGEPGPSACLLARGYFLFWGYPLEVFFNYFLLFRFWFLGFLAFRLLGFLVFWLFGFLAFRLLIGLCGFWWLFGFGFRIVAFWLLRLFAGLCGFWWLDFLHPLLSHSGLFGFCTLLVFGFGFPHPQHHQFLPIWIITSSNIMGGPPPTTPALLFWLFAEHPCLNHHFFNHLGGSRLPHPNPPPPRYFLDFLNCTPNWIIIFSIIQIRDEKML